MLVTFTGKTISVAPDTYEGMFDVGGTTSKLQILKTKLDDHFEIPNGTLLSQEQIQEFFKTDGAKRMNEIFSNIHDLGKVPFVVKF